MATDKTIKADPAPKAATAPKSEPAKEKPKDKASSEAAPAKAEGTEKAAAAPASYSRGEGQKPVSKAYKDNWNAIFAKKRAKKKKR